jgi:hypothetical protein
VYTGVNNGGSKCEGCWFGSPKDAEKWSVKSFYAGGNLTLAQKIKFYTK